MQENRKTRNIASLSDVTIPCSNLVTHAVRCRYSAANFLQYPYDSHPIARP